MATTSPPPKLQGRNEGHAPWLLRRIWDRVNLRNEHFMGVIVGREGSGKSHTAIKIADEVDPSFTADRVIFDVSELLKILRDGNHEPGNFYVLDEAGVQFGRRTWQERGQVLTNQALQLIRDHNLGLLFTLPRLSELDSQAQGRLQAFLELTEKEDGEFVRGKWKWMDPDRADDTGTIYKKFPRRIQNGRRIRVTTLAFRPPPEDIVSAYEEEKSEFQKEFYEQVIQELDDGDDGEDGDDGMGPSEVAEEIVSDGLEEYVMQHPQNKSLYIEHSLIAADYDLSQRKSRQAKKLVEREVNLDELEVQP